MIPYGIIPVTICFWYTRALQYSALNAQLDDSTVSVP